VIYHPASTDNSEPFRGSNIPSRTLLRLVNDLKIGSDLWIEYKSTLLYRHWVAMHGNAAALEMVNHWVGAWKESQPVADLPDTLLSSEPSSET